MKAKIVFLLLLSSIFCGSFFSCSEDDDGGYAKKQNKENTVLFKVYSNTPTAPITIQDIPEGYLIIKDHWERQFVTKLYGAQFSASCDDKDVLITGEIYVNGKLLLKREGNRYISLNVDFK